MNTDADKIIFLLNRSSFWWRNDGKDSTLHHYWLFQWNFHLFSLEFFLFQDESSFSFTVHVIWNPFRPIIRPANGNSLCGETPRFLYYREERNKKIHSCDFPVGCFARIDFCMTLETSHKPIFSMKIIFSDFNFSTNQNSRKNQIQIIDYFAIGNDRRVNTDAGIIIFLLIKSYFRWRNDREDPTFHHYWLF